MDVVTLRRMAWKSVFTTGKHEGLSVENVMDIDKGYLFFVYYNYSNITFIDEILQFLNITGDKVISKPGKNPGIHERYIREFKMHMCNDFSPEVNRKNLMECCRLHNKRKGMSNRALKNIERKFNKKGANAWYQQGHGWVED